MAYVVKGTVNRMTAEQKLVSVGHPETAYETGKGENNRFELVDEEKKVDAQAPADVEWYESDNYFYAEWRNATGKFRVKSTSEAELVSALGGLITFTSKLSFWKAADGSIAWDEVFEAWASAPTNGKYAKRTSTRKLADIIGTTDTVVNNLQPQSTSRVRR